MHQYRYPDSPPLPMGSILYLPFVKTVGIRQRAESAKNTGFHPFTGPGVRAIGISNNVARRGARDTAKTQPAGRGLRSPQAGGARGAQKTCSHCHGACHPADRRLFALCGSRSGLPYSCSLPYALCSLLSAASDPLPCAGCCISTVLTTLTTSTVLTTLTTSTV